MGKDRRKAIYVLRKKGRVDNEMYRRGKEKEKLAKKEREKT